MSNALAIAGVTAVLQHYLHNLYVSEADQLPFSGTCVVSRAGPGAGTNVEWNFDG